MYVFIRLQIFVKTGLSPQNVSKPSEEINDCVEFSDLPKGLLRWESVIPSTCTVSPGMFLGIRVNGKLDHEYLSISLTYLKF